MINGVLSCDKSSKIKELKLQAIRLEAVDKGESGAKRSIVRTMGVPIAETITLEPVPLKDTFRYSFLIKDEETQLKISIIIGKTESGLEKMVRGAAEKDKQVDVWGLYSSPEKVLHVYEIGYLGPVIKSKVREPIKKEQIDH